MKKKFIYVAAFVALFAASCKEHGVSIDTNDNLAEDTTYVGSVQPAETKNFLCEELSGVRCSNCPEGAEFLEELNTQNQNRFRIVAIHAGSLTNMIKDRVPNSIQDFTTEDGKKILQLVFGESGNKPCVAFDRWPIGNGSNKYLVDGANNWPPKIADMKTRRDKTPVNLKVESAFNSEKDQYDITVTLNYTEAVTGSNKLFVYLTENNIKDAFIESDSLITYNHVFRKAITSADGRMILDSLPTKQAGRVYIYRTSLKIDQTDAKQNAWKPENIKVVAFVSAAATDDKSVYQVQETNLKN